MLAYRHGYHAGNHADVLKHAVWLYVLNYLARKDKGFAIIDTHAGAGSYDLESEHARKLQEHRGGLLPVAERAGENAPAMLRRYLEAIAIHRQVHGEHHYPGSFGLSLACKRHQDRCVGFELHPTDHEALKRFCAKHRDVACLREDGFRGLTAHVPPAERRAAVILDPSYELKSDYEAAPRALQKAHRKFPTGTYVLWYPVVRRAWTQSMLNRIATSGVRRVLRLELLVEPDRDEPGMTGSGLAVVNPPYTLARDGEETLSWLATTLRGSGRTEWLVPE